jgi:hypothetical protein
MELIYDWHVLYARLDAQEKKRMLCSHLLPRMDPDVPWEKDGDG